MRSPPLEHMTQVQSALQKQHFDTFAPSVGLWKNTGRMFLCVFADHSANHEREVLGAYLKGERLKGYTVLLTRIRRDRAEVDNRRLRTRPEAVEKIEGVSQT